MKGNKKKRKKQAKRVKEPDKPTKMVTKVSKDTKKDDDKDENFFEKPQMHKASRMAPLNVADENFFEKFMELMSWKCMMSGKNTPLVTWSVAILTWKMEFAASQKMV